MDPSNNHSCIYTKDITKNITLYTNGPFKGEIDANTLEFREPRSKPLVLMMAWLTAKPKHKKKYAQVYINLGFDVVVVQITLWQGLWPTIGSHVIAGETINFLEHNKSYAPIVVHGFSAGAYQMGEIMVQMSKDLTRYAQIIERIYCQIWDSAADVTEIPEGLAKTIFPKNPSMQNFLRKHTSSYLRTFYNEATIHYERSSEMFHNTLLKKPALVFVSENDLIGPPSSSLAVRKKWERANIKVTIKIWKNSLHAGHILKHREEYLHMLFQHLKDSGVLDISADGVHSKL